MSHQFHDRAGPYGAPNSDMAAPPGRRPPPQTYSPAGRQQRPPPVRPGHQAGPPPGSRGPMRPPPPPQQYRPESPASYYEDSTYGGADEFDQWPLPSRPFAPSGRNSPGGSPRGSPRGSPNLRGSPNPNNSPRGPPPQRPQRPDYQEQVLGPPRPTARIAPAERSYRQPPPPQPSQHGSGQWTGDGYRSPQPPYPPPNRPPPQAAHPPPTEFQQPQALHQAVYSQHKNQRAPLGPPPSARRGPAFNYPPVAPVHPIVEETDSMRGSIRNASTVFSGGHSSYASSNAIPIGIPGYYLEERGSGYSHPSAAMGRPSMDSSFSQPSGPMGRPSIESKFSQQPAGRGQPSLDAYDERRPSIESKFSQQPAGRSQPSLDMYGERDEGMYDGGKESARDHAESPSPEPAALIRQASLGKRSKPTLTTVKSGERMNREGEGQQRNYAPPTADVPQINREMVRGRMSTSSSEDEDLAQAERSGQEEKALEAAGVAGAGMAAVGAAMYAARRPDLGNRTPSSSDILSSGTGLLDPSSDESEKAPKKRRSRELLGAMLGKDRTSRSRSRSPLSLIANDAVQRNSVMAGSEREAATPIEMDSPGPGFDDQHPGRRSLRLDIDAVRDAEARGSLTSLPDLIRRATKLASNLDRGKTASRLGMNFLEGLNSTERALAVEAANRRHSNASDMLGVYSTDPRTPDGFTRFSKLQHTQLPSDSDAGEMQVPKKRKCCGMPVWLFVVLLILVFLLIAAAVMVPVVLLIILPSQNSSTHHTVPATSSKLLARCESQVRCLNGGNNILTNDGFCRCVCVNGFTGSRCTMQARAACTTISVGETEDATVGDAIPALFDSAESDFGIPLDREALLGLFSSSDMSCSDQNALVAFSALSRRGGLLEARESEVWPLTTIAGRQASSVDTVVLDFAKVAILYVLQDSAQATEAVAAQGKLQDYFSNQRTGDGAVVKLGNGYSCDLTSGTLTLRNGTTIGS